MTPLKIAVKDTDEIMTGMFVNYFSKPQEKKWLVRWLTDPPSETWEEYKNLKNVEAFQHYCVTNRLDSFPPKLTPQFFASVPNISRRAATGQFTFPPVEPTVVQTKRPPTNANVPARRKHGRPEKGPPVNGHKPEDI